MDCLKWKCLSKSTKTIDVQVEGPITDRLIKKIKKERPGYKIKINGKKY